MDPDPRAMPPISVFWFRQDLRIHDNPGLTAAAEHGAVLPLYIADPASQPGCASLWWLHQSLQALNKSLKNGLHYAVGDPITVLRDVCTRYTIRGVYWNHSYDPADATRDRHLCAALEAAGVPCLRFQASLLWEPTQILTAHQTPYQIFAAFYKACLRSTPPRTPLPPPAQLDVIRDPAYAYDASTIPKHPKHAQFSAHWQVGESAARAQYLHFLAHGLSDYAHGRDFPSQQRVSRLSPYLHFGELSAAQLWSDLALRPGMPVADPNQAAFCRQLVWREFSHHLLFHFPDLPHRPFQAQFEKFPWRSDPTHLQAWCTGQTGYPMVDAGIRELQQTGYMHNRVRMIVGSFLVKNLRLPWQEGARWFLEGLVDADRANNSASWQWVAGSGTDAAPYFRIFNPVLQGKRYDPEGTYICTFVPELRALPRRYLHAPWTAPASVLKEAGVVLGTTYPEPIVDLQETRAAALAAFAACKAPNTENRIAQLE